MGDADDAFLTTGPVEARYRLWHSLFLGPYVEKLHAEGLTVNLAQAPEAHVRLPRFRWFHRRRREDIEEVERFLAWWRSLAVLPTIGYLQQAAEAVARFAHDPDLLDPVVRTLPTQAPDEGIGSVEAPRGTLIHHYRSDSNGIITAANLIVATVHNSAPIQMSVQKAAKGVIHGGVVDQGLLNMVEMAFRAYDPCFVCATHALPGEMPLTATIRDARGAVVRVIERRAGLGTGG